MGLFDIFKRKKTNPLEEMFDKLLVNAFPGGREQ